MSSPRRLAAILAADVVGFSRLMGEDEEGTLAAWNERRTAIVDPAMARRAGRIFKTTGDGFLAEFGSVVEAVRCATEIQDAMADANRPLAEGTRIDLRIGINLGDVIVEGDDLFGDGVNVAARLEGLAPTGGIALSATAHDHVRDRLALVFADAGEQAVKNIARPVRVFTWRVDGHAPAAAAARAASAFPPDRPSIAVLPFDNLSGDADQDYFADGMVEEILTGLSRVRSLFVIARNSSFTYKGRAVDIRAVGRELGVRYVLEGSVRRGGDRVRITAQLIEAATGSHLWAEKYDGALGDVFDLQDRITMDVVRAIEPSVLLAEIERTRRKRPENLDAYDHFLRAMPLVWTSMPQRATEALAHLDAALALNPDYMAAHAFASFCHEARFAMANHDPADRALGLQHARTVLRSGTDDATALAIAAFEVALIDRDYSASFHALASALALNPNSSLALAFSALVNAFVGNQAAAIDFAGKADRHSPFDPLRWVSEGARSIAFVHSGRFAEAVRAAIAALHLMPGLVGAHVALITAYVGLGQMADAQAATRRLREAAPQYRLGLLAEVTIGPPDKTALMIAALRAAGLPE